MHLNNLTVLRYVLRAISLAMFSYRNISLYTGLEQLCECDNVVTL